MTMFELSALAVFPLFAILWVMITEWLGINPKGVGP